MATLTEDTEAGDTQVITVVGTTGIIGEIIVVGITHTAHITTPLIGVAMATGAGDMALDWLNLI